MIEATDIKSRGKKGFEWVVTAMVNDIPYQKRFGGEPTINELNDAVESFERNYAGLNDATNKPVIVKPHHSEEA